MKNVIILGAAILTFVSCSDKKDYDATGMFETTEITVSGEGAGKVMNLEIEEGDTLLQNQTIGYIDTVQLYLSKLQLMKNRNSIEINRPKVSIQIAAIKEQIAKQQLEKDRVTKLIASSAATQKQLDDINSAIRVLEKQLEAQLSTLNNNVESLDAQSSAVEIQIAQIDDKLRKCHIISPVNGVILDKYINQGELVGIGTPLFKIGDTENVFLRAYVTSAQLSEIKLGQSVKVFADFGGGITKEFSGKITWISEKSEFTPKGILTSDDRENSVYAIKIAVKNDGTIKLGMYGEVKF